MKPVAALYVERQGCYFGLPGVDPWDEARDARKYRGPHPIVSHTPCPRWGPMWFGQPLTGTGTARFNRVPVQAEDIGGRM